MIIIAPCLVSRMPNEQQVTSRERRIKMAREIMKTIEWLKMPETRCIKDLDDLSEISNLLNQGKKLIL